MFPNMLIVALAALVPLVIGFVYYNPNVLGKAWMKVSGMTEEKMKEGNMAVIYGTAYVLSFLAAFWLFTLVVHQTDHYSLLMNEPGFGEDGSETMSQIGAFMEAYGDRFRTFGHGATHGGLIGLFIGLPILLTNGLFEGKGFKYGFINAGYWIITFALMGGILCQWA